MNTYGFCFGMLAIVFLMFLGMWANGEFDQVIKPWRERRKQNKSRRAELEAYRAKRNEIYRRMKVLTSFLLLWLPLLAFGQIQHDPLMEQPLPDYRPQPQRASRWLPEMLLTLGGQTTNPVAPPLPGTNNASGLYNFFKPLLQATNYAFEPYATYAPSAPKQWGGGILAVYDLSDFVAPGVGVDYLGHFSLVSATVSLRMPIHLNSIINVSWLTNVTVIPGLLGGMGEPLSGTSGTSAPTTIADAFDYIQFGHLFGGQLNIGAAYGKWFNAGPYSVNRYHLFAGWSKGF